MKLPVNYFATFDPETGALEPVLERTSGGLQAKLNMEGEGIEPASGTSVRGQNGCYSRRYPRWHGNLWIGGRRSNRLPP